MIIDYSTFRPTTAQLKSAGVTAVGRYIGWDSVPGFASIGKNVTAGEAAELRAAGIQIFLSFEYAAQAALSGASQGKKDGQLATEQLHDLGAPEDMTVYFALDFDIPDFAPHSDDPKAKLGAATAYFEAIHALQPAYTVGVYGGYYAVKRVLDAGLATMGWQTIAWSGGQWDGRAVLRQLASQVFGAADVDLQGAHAIDFGQWPRPNVKPAPPASGKHVMSGNQSLRAFVHYHGRTVQEVVWETAHREPGFGPLQAAYIAEGNWDALTPKGMIVWLP